MGVRSGPYDSSVEVSMTVCVCISGCVCVYMCVCVGGVGCVWSCQYMGVNTLRVLITVLLGVAGNKMDCQYAPSYCMVAHTFL